jgi:DNA polymerase delta subunit 2
MSSQKYYSDDGSDAVNLEDESGRIRLVGDVLKSAVLVTGCIIAVLGSENVHGELEVIDIKFPDLPPQPDRWALSKPPGANGTSKANKVLKDEDEEMIDAKSTAGGGKIAIVSGLGFSGSDASHAIELSLLLEYLLGETLDPTAQRELSQISRLIIAGNSISLEDNHRPADEAHTEKKAHKKYGYDASSYNAQPSQMLDDFLSTLLPTMPITMLPGEHDPANASYPQQPIHVAMFPNARAYTAAPTVDDAGWFDNVTNPWEAEVDGWRFLGTGGQNVDDVFKYIDSDDRLGMMEAMCRWRCCAPTAPDTLCKSCPPLELHDRG